MSNELNFTLQEHQLMSPYFLNFGLFKIHESLIRIHVKLIETGNLINTKMKHSKTPSLTFSIFKDSVDKNKLVSWTLTSRYKLTGKCKLHD